MITALQIAFQVATGAALLAVWVSGLWITWRAWRIRKLPEARMAFFAWTAMILLPFVAPFVNIGIELAYEWLTDMHYTWNLAPWNSLMFAAVQSVPMALVALSLYRLARRVAHNDAESQAPADTRL